jgi:hypothetical protein
MQDSGCGTARAERLQKLGTVGSGGVEDDIAAQTRALLALRGDLNTAADAVHRIESVRVQLDGVAKVVDDAQVKAAAAQLQQKLMDLEMNLVDLRLTGQGQDGVRFAAKLISKLNYLAGGVGSSDFRPTDQHGQVQQILGEELRTNVSALEALLAKDLAAFNEMLRGRGIPNILVKAAKPIA